MTDWSIFVSGRTFGCYFIDRPRSPLYTTTLVGNGEDLLEGESE